MYVNKQTLEPVTRPQIRAAHPHTSFPREIPADWMEANGYAQVIDTQPEPAPGQNSVADGIELVDGQYRRKWRYENVIAPVETTTEEKLAATDPDLIRVIEDVIKRQDALIAALAVDVPDLPVEARGKIQEREAIRQELTNERKR